MEQVGLVIEVKADRAVVAVRRHDVCAKCGGCGVAVSGRGETHMEALNSVNAVVGQTVRVTHDTAQVLKASFMVYMVPIIALLVGLYIGQTLGGAYRLDIVLGIVFLVGSYIIIRDYDRRVAGRQALATVTEILPEPFDGPADEKC